MRVLRWFHLAIHSIQELSSWKKEYLWTSSLVCCLWYLNWLLPLTLLSSEWVRYSAPLIPTSPCDIISMLWSIYFEAGLGLTSTVCPSVTLLGSPPQKKQTHTQRTKKQTLLNSPNTQISYELSKFSNPTRPVADCYHKSTESSISCQPSLQHSP